MDILVHLHPLPGSIRGFITERDGAYIIIINELLSMEERMEAYFHELGHLLRGDLESSEDVAALEGGLP